MLAEYDQKLKAAEQTVQAMVAEARRDAERTSQDLIANAQREVGLIRDRAKDDIRQATDTALAEVSSLRSILRLFWQRSMFSGVLCRTAIRIVWSVRRWLKSLADSGPVLHLV